MSDVPDRNGHVPVHRHRGLDEAPPGARRRLRVRVVADHRRILREAFGAAGGREVDTQGDAFFYSFPRARDAVAAAVAGQRALAAHEWPGGASVRVRMGLHTGEPAVGDEGYVGLDVVRAARICSAGHGGQVLLSETTRALVGSDLPEGVSIRDLGEQKLKDVRAERLYQLELGGSPQYFPLLRTEGRARDFGDRISRHVESMVEAQLNSVFAGGKPPTAKLAGLTALRADRPLFVVPRRPRRARAS